MFVHSTPVRSMPSPVVAVIAIFALRALASWDSDETRSNLAVGSRFRGTRFLRTLQAHGN